MSDFKYYVHPSWLHGDDEIARALRRGVEQGWAVVTYPMSEDDLKRIAWDDLVPAALTQKDLLTEREDL